MINTVAGVRARLKAGPDFRDGGIALDGIRIGRWVSYGAGRGQGNVGSRTVYGSRIYRGVSIEEEAGSTRVLLDKVARRIAKAMKDGTWKEKEQ